MRRLAVCLVLLGLAGCGIKGEPRAPGPAADLPPLPGAALNERE